MPSGVDTLAMERSPTSGVDPAEPGPAVSGSQGSIVAAAAFAAARLARPDGLEDGLLDVLGRVGVATGADRVYVYRNHLGAEGGLVMSIHAEWAAPGVPGTTHDPENLDFPYERGFASWATELGAGHSLAFTRSTASREVSADMESEAVFAQAVVPVFVDGSWWGFVGLDDCTDERAWERPDLDALKVVAETLGGALARDDVMRAARSAEERYRRLVEHLPAAVYIDALNDSATTMYASPKMLDVTGYSAEEWEANTEMWVELLHPDDRDRALTAQARHNETCEPFREEYRIITKDGDVRWIRDEAIIIRDAGGQPEASQGFMLDVTDVKVAEERIEFLAYRDPLTGLANQDLFVEVAEMALARARRGEVSVAVLSLDLDRFKLANDTLGKDGGDRLLLAVAERLGGVIRDTDTLARRGGDEFLVLLSDLERTVVGEMTGPLLYAETVAGRVREALARPFSIDGTEIYVSASVGIAVFPDDADDVQDLLRLSETAMVQSKHAGPGGFVVSTVGAVDSATKLAFVTKLRKAVERREWQLYYQPIVQLTTGAAIGVEGLLRWETSAGEFIPPNEFIPLAEELGLIEEIGDWVVEELVRQDTAWRAEGLRLEMGFNLSPRQFWQPDLAERILLRLDEQGVDPSHVVVEVTESSAMRDPDLAQSVLADLHDRGLRVAIDDFGTGYSSLSRLRHLPIDVLKIDRSFVSEVDHDPQAAEIVSAFITLGRGLGMATLAEGIETEAEWRFLAERGCELGQGYFFSRPVPAAEITARYRAGTLLLAEV